MWVEPEDDCRLRSSEGGVGEDSAGRVKCRGRDESAYRHARIADVLGDDGIGGVMEDEAMLELE
jgi:hypothetical protein